MKGWVMRWFGAVLLGLSLVLVSPGAGAQIAVSVESMPPTVVKTSPQSGDTKVDPSTSEIRVTFSKDMMTEEM